MGVQTAVKMQVLDLFSGIGGFSLGLESTGLFETVAFCEKEEYAKRVLRRHFPRTEIFHDFNHYGWLSVPGFVGSREKERFEREPQWLDFRPDWILIENEGHRWKRWVPELRRALWERGYSSLPIRVRADFMGFPHRRARVFIVAHTDSLKLRKLQRWWFREGREVAAKLAKPGNRRPNRLGTDDGLPSWLHMDFRAARRRVLGNSVIPQIVALIGYGVWWTETIG